MPPARLALVITELEMGGAERCLVELACRLDRSQFAPFVISLAPPPPPGKRGALVERLAAAGVPTHSCHATRIWAYPRAVRALRALLLRERVDLVQSFLFHANTTAARSVRRVPACHFIAGLRVADPRRWRMAVERRTLGRAAGIVCVSEAVAHHARRRVGLAPEKLLVIPNGVDLSPFEHCEPADLSAQGIKHDDPVLLFVGRLDVQKGLDWLLSVASHGLTRHPRLQLVLAGDGPQQRALRKQARESAVFQRIHFLGWRSDVPGLLRRARLLVLPSRWEGMPNILLEAMAARRVVIATRAEGVEQILGDDADLQCVDFGHDAQLLERMDRFLNNESLTRQTAEKNYQRVASHFSMTTMLGAYQHLFRQVLDPHDDPPRPHPGAG